MSESQQVTLARIALRRHGGVTQDEKGCDCEHCIALRGLVERVERLGAALEDVALVAGSKAAERIRALLAEAPEQPSLCPATTIYHDAPDGNPHPLLCARPRGHAGDHLSSGGIGWP